MPVKITTDKFYAGEKNILMKGYDLTKEHNIQVKLKGEKTILFKMLVPKSIKFYEILKPNYREIPQIDEDEGKKRLEAYNRNKIFTNIPIANYSNILENKVIPFGISIENKIPVNYIQLEEMLEILLFIEDVRNNDIIPFVNMTTSVTRDNFELYNGDYTSDNNGVVELKIPITYRNGFYPNHCYELIVDAQYNEFTSTKILDFKVNVATSYDNFVDTVDSTIFYDKDYDHFPPDYKFHPREILKEDRDCNDD